ncbi:hypothetical protein [Pseudomonas sp. CC120222-01a]|uniref:hypothetical protein n=1 Tax=Pseudomonas sp. CC120222-01a TaxID=1378075 RepID=UPI000D8190B2|nr:hypothetical protein [Pseudomonas sp. CC120222-01a]PVZ42647.1 hypothetical protein N430_01260 [Pseudomonas sp. CC120222-01a]
MTWSALHLTTTSRMLMLVVKEYIGLSLSDALKTAATVLASVIALCLTLLLSKIV